MSFNPSFFGRHPRSNFFDHSPWDAINELAVWDPFNTDIPAPMVPFNTGFPFSNSHSFPHSQFPNEISAFTSAPLNRSETPEAHVFRVEIPGLNKDEVKVEIENGGFLKISGKRSRKKEEKNAHWYRSESSSGKFSRRYRLPNNAKMDQMEVSMENGVLNVSVPKY